MSQYWSFAEKQAEKAENLVVFSGVKLIHIKRQITLLLSLVGKGGIFDQYTKHDISHIDKMLDIVEWVIPDDTKKKMSPADWLMIVLSIYFHDLGMLVTVDEYKNRNKSGFKDYRKGIFDNVYGLEYKNQVEVMLSSNFEDAERFIYQEYIRSKHAERIKFWIQGIQNDALGISNEVVTEINNLLQHLPAKFRVDLGVICESHHLMDLDDFNKYKISYPYGSTTAETVNIHYCALILRTVDLLHITSDRTPSIEFRVINPSDPISQIEWLKQMAVSSVRPMLLSQSSDDDTEPKKVFDGVVEVTAYFDKPEKAEAFFSLIGYLTYAKKQLSQTYKWADLAQKKHGSKFTFPWKDINDDSVETNGFERQLFHFSLDQPKILNLLIGHTLYNDSTVVLRELIQNSIDAVRLQREVQGFTSNEEILIKWNSKERVLEINDNGTGMDRVIIENHLLKVGSSRYQDEEFKKKHPDFSPISRFGIGILTCFLISNNIEITTAVETEERGLNLVVRNVDGKYLLRNIDKNTQDTVFGRRGTSIKLHVRNEVVMGKLEEDIKKWILFPPCSVSLKIDDKKPIAIGYSSPKRALEDFLQNVGFKLGEKYKVEETELHGVKMAYALEYSYYFKEWTFLKVQGSSRDESNLNPIGIAIEGVRVEFNTPGFKEKNLYAVANTSGKGAPKTNVARSIIEDNNERLELYRSIYDIYMAHISFELKQLSDKSDFSITWASNEANYFLYPFTGHETRYSNSKILDLSLSALNCIVVEKNKTRTIASAEAILKQNKVFTIDCELYKSAEMILKEVPGNTSLMTLLETLYQGESDNLNVEDYILCGYRPQNKLHDIALQGKHVKEIRVYYDKRRVDLIWEETTIPVWKNIVRQIETSNSPRTLNCFVQIGNVSISGLNDEVAVKAFDRYYILAKSPFHAVLSDMINTLDLSIDENLLAVAQLADIGEDFFDGFIEMGDTKRLEKNIEDRLSRMFGFNADKNLWNFVDRSRVYEAIQSTSWKVFDPVVWKRNRMVFYDYEY